MKSLPWFLAALFAALWLYQLNRPPVVKLNVPPGAIRVLYICPHHDKPNAFREPLPDLAEELDKLLARRKK